jgi:hypothetical protein
MSTSFVAQKPVLFPEHMLVRIALGEPPDIVAEEFGYEYHVIKDQQHFQVQYRKVETELFQEGSVTRVVAGAGLHTIVEKVAYRALDDRVSNGDLVKMGEFLKKVKDDGKEKDAAAAKPQFTIEIVIGGDGKPSGNVEIDVTPTDSPVAILDEADDYSVLDDEPPESVMDAFRNTDTSLTFGVDFED